MEMNSPQPCPYTVTVRRNPPRRARPTPAKAPLPFPNSSTPSSRTRNISSFPTEDLLAVEVPKKITKSDEENLKVFLRIRPQSSIHGPGKQTSAGVSKNVWPQNPSKKATPKSKKKSEVCLREIDSHSVTLCPPQSLQDQKRNKSEVYEGFSHVFSADSSQDEVFEKMMNPIVEDFLKGKSGMLAALGPSGSGKTHTIFGTARLPGMIPLALRRLFSETESNQPHSDRTFFLSMFEISSERGKTEKMLDLCNEGVDISMQQSTIRGLHESVVRDVQQAESLIAQGMLKRATAMTNSNSQSSRSQCIINIRCETHGEVNAPSDSALLTIVDLAGAEREKRTGNQGARLLESNFINNTSMVFGLCLRSLLEHQKNRKKPMQKHFQNSLLTRYLRDYLEGKKRMALILTIKSGEKDYLDASFLLRQASPFMKIKFTNSEEPSDLIGNKRQFQAFLKADQHKRMKLSTFESCVVNEGKTDGVDMRPHQEERVNEITAKKLNEVGATDVLAQSSETLKSEICESTSVKDNITALKRNRESQIMQGFAKATWQVLKQYKEKLKVAEKEIYCLRQSLTEEKARSVNLEEELAHLKSSFSCDNILLTDKILINDAESTEDGLDESAELQGYQSADSHEVRRSCVVSTSFTNREIFEAQSFQSINPPGGAEDLEIWKGRDDTHQKGDDFPGNILIVDNQDQRFEGRKDMCSTCIGTDNVECSIQPVIIISEDTSSSAEGNHSQDDAEEVVGVSSLNLIESAEFTVTSQSSDSTVRNSCVVSTSCVGGEIFEEKCCQKSVDSPRGAEDLKILKGRDNFHQKYDDIPGNINIIGDPNHKCEMRMDTCSSSAVTASSTVPVLECSDSSSTVEGHQSQNDAVEKLSDQTVMSNDDIASANICNPNYAPEVASKVVSYPKPPNAAGNAGKPKRRLQPASSILLKNISGFDILEENDKPKGARGAKSMGLDLSRKTQGSLSLLRLLKDNF